MNNYERLQMTNVLRCGTPCLKCVTLMNKLPAISFVFDRRKNATLQNPAAVELKIYFNREKRFLMSTGVQVFSGQWSESFHVVGRSDAVELNMKLASIYNQQIQIFAEMNDSGIEITKENYLVAIKEFGVKTLSFPEYMEQRIKERNLRSNTKHQHTEALNALRRFGKVEAFTSLTPENIQAFDIFLRNENPKRMQTTIHGYHKRIKPYVIEAYKLGYISLNPYVRFVDKRGTHRPRKPLTARELDMLRAAKLNDKLSRVRDLFIFCCYTGLSYADMNLFDYYKDVVKDNGMQYIDGERFKTGTGFYTPLLHPALEVLERYSYKLPSLSVQNYNDYLHVIEEKLEFRKPLTSHIARHTYATTVCLANDVPIEVVSRMLGHKHISTTEIYAKVMNSSVENHAKKLNGIINL